VSTTFDSLDPGGYRFERGACVENLMENRHYTVILERESDGGYHAFCPVLKGCHTQGDTLDESLVNIREAIEVYLESLKASGEPFPVEDILIRPIEVAA
jgi:predicted RNase H-like HicB family nuclease